MSNSAAWFSSFVCIATASGLGVEGSSNISVMCIQLRKAVQPSPATKARYAAASMP